MKIEKVDTPAAQNLPEPWIRCSEKHTDKPSWYNPEDRASIKWVVKKKYELSVRRTFKKNGATLDIDEIIGYFDTFTAAWKAYNWLNGYKI